MSYDKEAWDAFRRETKKLHDTQCCVCEEEIGPEDAGHTIFGWVCVICIEYFVSEWLKSFPITTSKPKRERS